MRSQKVVSAKSYGGNDVTSADVDIDFTPVKQNSLDTAIKQSKP